MNKKSKVVRFFQNQIPRFFQLRLRSLFLLLTVLIILTSIYSGRALKQRRVLEWVDRNEGYYYYRYQMDLNSHYLPNSQPPGPDWVRNLVGVDFFASVHTVGVGDYFHKLPDISPLGDLTDIEELHICLEDTGTLEPLGRIRGIKILTILESRNHNLMPLHNLTTLKELYFATSTVDPEELNALRKALPNCKIEAFEW